MSESAQDISAAERTVRLYALGELALWTGVIGFGGGLTVLSSMRNTLVEKRRWMTEAQFNDAATVAQMLPGGAAANLLAYVGLRFAGIPGALTAYLGFIAPGALSVVALSWVYVRFGMTPHVEAVLSGFNAAVVGVVAAITLKMLRGSIGRPWQMAVAVGALLLGQVGGAGAGEVALLGITAGLAVYFGGGRLRQVRFPRWKKALPARVALPEEGHTLTPPESDKRSVLKSVVLATTLGASLASFSRLIELAVVFFRTGLGAYGGGFAIIPQLQAAVHNHGWLTDRQFLDGVAVGKLTPGPVLLMATFIGYVRQGWVGALVSTVAIFAAPFALTVLLSSWLDRVRTEPWVLAALAGLTPAVVGLMAGAAITLGSAITGTSSMAIAVAVALTLSRFEVNPVWMLVLGGTAQIAIRHFAAG